MFFLIDGIFKKHHLMRGGKIATAKQQRNAFAFKTIIIVFCIIV